MLSAIPKVGRVLRGVGRLLSGASGAVTSRAGKVTTGARAFGGHLANSKVGRPVMGAGRFAAEHYWTLDSIIGKLNNMTDSFTHVITVKCVGGPAADLRRVYYLALAAVFGRYSRATTRVKGSFFELACSTDVTDKSVTVTLGYSTALIGDIIRDATNSRTPLDVIFDGPDQFTIGRGWTGPFFTTKGAGSTYAKVVEGQEIRGGGVRPALVEAIAAAAAVPPGIAGIPDTPPNPLQWIVAQPDILRKSTIPVAVFRPWVLQSPLVDPARELPSLARNGKTRRFFMRRVVPPHLDPYTVVETREGGRVPRLPDDGRVITTGETRDPRLQPPRPPVDGIARGSLLALTVQALTDPGYLPELPGLTETPLGTGGVYWNAPGESAPGGIQQGSVREEEPPPIERAPAVRVPLPFPFPVVDVPLPYLNVRQVPLLRDPLR